MKITIISSFRLFAGDNDFRWTGEADVTRDDDEPTFTNAEIVRLFNRVEFEDHTHLEKLGYRLPSLSAGDIIVWEPASEPVFTTRPRIWLVDTVGFKEIMPGLGLIGENQ